MATQQLINGHMERAVALTERLWDVLAPENAPTQGAVTADLMAMWIAQHLAMEGEDQAEIDEELFMLQLRQVRDLLIHYRRLGWPASNNRIA